MKALIIVLLNILSFCAIAQMSLNEQIDSLEQVVSRIRTELNNKEGELSEVLSQLSVVKNEKLLDSIGSQEQYITAKLNMMGRLREEGRASSPVIQSIAKQSSVKLISFSNRYWYINYEDTFGFLSDIYFVETEEIKSFKEALIKQNKELELKKNREAYQNEMAQRRAVVDSVDSIMNIERIEHQKQLAEWEKQLAKWGKESEEREKKRKSDCIAIYGNEIGQKLINGSYWIGMTDEMARLSLGYPKDVNRTVGSWGTHEQWVYSMDLMLYFENGILKSYQN